MLHLNIDLTSNAKNECKLNGEVVGLYKYVFLRFIYAVTRQI